VAQVSYNVHMSFKELNDSIEYNSSYGHRLNVETPVVSDETDKMTVASENFHLQPKAAVDDIFKSKVPYKLIPNFSKPLSLLNSKEFN